MSSTKDIGRMESVKLKLAPDDGRGRFRVLEKRKGKWDRDPSAHESNSQGRDPSTLEEKPLG